MMRGGSGGRGRGTREADATLGREMQQELKCPLLSPLFFRSQVLLLKGRVRMKMFIKLREEEKVPNGEYFHHKSHTDTQTSQNVKGPQNILTNYGVFCFVNKQGCRSTDS